MRVTRTPPAGERVRTWHIPAAVLSAVTMCGVALVHAEQTPPAVFTGGTFEGTFGVPPRPGLFTLRPTSDRDVELSWRLTDGRRGTLATTREGSTVRWVDNRHRCALSVDASGSAVTGRCVEMLMAEARAPMEFMLDGKKLAGPPGVVLPGMRLPLPVGWDWSYVTADSAVVRNAEDQPVLVLRVVDGQGGLEGLTREVLAALEGRLGRLQVDHASATRIQGVEARQVRAQVVPPKAQPSPVQQEEPVVKQTLGLWVTARSGKVYSAAATFPSAVFEKRMETVTPVLAGWLWVDAPVR